jgi:hypothetical protein
MPHATAASQDERRHGHRTAARSRRCSVATKALPTNLRTRRYGSAETCSFGGTVGTPTHENSCSTRRTILICGLGPGVHGAVDRFNDWLEAELRTEHAAELEGLGPLMKSTTRSRNVFKPRLMQAHQLAKARRRAPSRLSCRARTVCALPSRPTLTRAALRRLSQSSTTGDDYAGFGCEHPGVTLAFSGVCMALSPWYCATTRCYSCTENWPRMGCPRLRALAS